MSPLIQMSLQSVDVHVTLSLPCFSIQININFGKKHELYSATSGTPPLESTHQELSFEWSHL